jgi:hypothetical protein
MSLDDILKARTALRASLTGYRHALVGASPELKQRLRTIIETLERLESGETPMALYEARKGAA